MTSKDKVSRKHFFQCKIKKKEKKKSYAVLGGRTSKKGHFSLSALSGVYAFVVLKKGVDLQEMDLHQQLNDTVSKKIAKYACPDCIQVILPHWF